MGGGCDTVSVESGDATAVVFIHFSSGDMRGGVVEMTAMTAAAERGGTADIVCCQQQWRQRQWHHDYFRRTSQRDRQRDVGAEQTQEMKAGGGQ